MDIPIILIAYKISNILKNLFSKCLDISIIYLAYKKDQHILVWRCQDILAEGYQEILDQKITQEIFKNTFSALATFHEYFSMRNCLEILFYGILKLITAWLTQFCVTIHPNLFIFDLAYTSCRNPFLCINWKSCWNLSRVPTFYHFHYFSSTKSGSISFFSSSNMHQSHHNVGYHEQVTTILSHIFSILYRSGTKCNAEG